MQTDFNIIIVPLKNLSYTPVDLNLTIYADPIAQIDLYKDNQLISSNNSIDYRPSGDSFTHYRLYVNDINQTGLYEYRATNSFGSISYSKHINIENQKPFIQSMPNETIVSGEELTLACYASGQPNLELKWIDQRTKQIVNTSRASPILLTTTNTQSNIYTCHASNHFGEDFQDVHVNIRIPAKILSMTANQTIQVNKPLKISCIAEGDNQFELILKDPFKQKLNVIEIQKNHEKNLSFRIENIQMSDSGLYECFARNNYSQDRSIINIRVQNIPDRIENLFVQNSNRISWTKPFDGNSKINKYLLRIKHQQGISFCFIC